ncbi:MAG: metallophosphoesterase [Kofleriaceae bacterium]
MTRSSVVLACALAAATCTRPSEERAGAEHEVGHAAAAGLTVDVTDRLAAIRTLAPGQLALWAAAPAIEVTVEVTPAAAGRWRLTVGNVVPDAVVALDGAALTAALPPPRPTVVVRDLDLTAGTHTLHVGAADAGAAGGFRVVAMADIQTGLPTVDQVFAAIATTQPRFVVCMGDLTDRGELAEYALLEAQLTTLPVPFYTTLGNHELWADSARYRDRYGPATFQFTYRGVAFTFADSGDAGLDPTTEADVDALLARAADRTQLFLTHFPPIDPIGVRDGSFRGRADGQRLIGKLAAAGVDLALYGHIHSYYAFEHAGIPAFVSGGGGAQPERWDGIGRHFLVLDLAAGAPPIVGLRRVD